MLQVLALLIGIGSTHAASDHPYTFALVVDEDPKTTERANKFVEYMRSTEPFSRMGAQLTFYIVLSTAETLKCSNNDSNSDRVIHCDNTVAAKLGAGVGANRTVVFTSKGSGGAGGSIPVASLDYSVPTMLHEIMHSFDFGDEYHYEVESELRAFCIKYKNRMNTAFFGALKPTYESSEDAMALHRNDFGWSGEVSPKTEIITGGKLGTAPGVYPEGTVGLFHAGICDAPKPNEKKPKVEWTPIDSWKPLNQSSIMGENYAKPPIPPLYAKWLVAKMAAERGKKITLLEPGHEDDDPKTAFDSSKGEISERTQKTLRVDDKPLGRKAD